MRRQVWVVTFLLTLLLITPGQIAAQQSVAKWLRYDVNITIQQNSGIQIEEIHEVSLPGGTTTFSRTIPTNKIESIGNISVLEINPNGGQRSYQAAKSGADYTFQTIVEENQQIIQLHFPPNNVSSTRFVLRYFLTGVLRFYDEGDRFDWQPFGSKNVAPIDTSNIVITLPATFASANVVKESSGFAQVNNFFSDGNKVRFTTANVPAGNSLEISVIFPHGVVQGSPPQWQTVADWTPVLQWGSIILGLLFLFISLLAVFGWWYFRIRVPARSSGKAPKYLGNPPSDLSPAVAGALLDGKTGPHHLLATLLDLAYRGAINIDQANQNSGSLLADNQLEPAFNLYAVDQEKATAPYEANLYAKIFGHLGGKKRQLSDIHPTVFMAVPELKKQVDLEIAKAGYFSKNIGVARRQYAAFGGAGLLISIVLALLVGVALGSRFTYLVVCPFAGLGMGGVALIIVGFFLPKRTEAGVKETVRWKAFKRYLKDMGVKDAAKVKSRFVQFLAYAVAFGLEQELIKKFEAANAPAPPWWGKPEEKLPDLSHGHAHEWVGHSLIASTPQKPQKSGGKTSLRRLGGK